ncbi:hypothetical protein [Streptomyces sp. NPDC049813]|uniref:hypothetical protein n=1 Tax=Streptomyces sp. NPDC049813 TaxID=3365597 RepID=UPI0037923210
MQIHRMPRHERGFTVIDNKAIRDPRLSHTARGILVYVLSLPSGTQVNVRTLSDGFPQGRLAVSKAVKELRELGYWVTRTEREPATRRIVSSVDVYEMPQMASPAPPPPPSPSPGTGKPVASKPVASRPVPTAPVSSRVGTGDSGTFFPHGKTNHSQDGGKNPPYPPVAAGGPHARESALILERIAVVDPRLRLSARAMRELAPEVVAWLERGASAAEIVDAVTAGLPGHVYSAARLIADRLSRKRPERKRAWRRVYECPECRDPLPWGQETGVCRSPECSPGTGISPQAGPQTGPRISPDAALQHA